MDPGESNIFHKGIRTTAQAKEKVTLLIPVQRVEQGNLPGSCREEVEVKYLDYDWSLNDE